AVRSEIALPDPPRLPLASGGPGDVERVQRRALVEKGCLARVDVLAPLVGPQRSPPEGDDPAATVLDRDHEAIPEPVVKPALGRADRKSTRLNSSHVSISYAVFCLKK